MYKVGTYRVGTYRVGTYRVGTYRVGTRSAKSAYLKAGEGGEVEFQLPGILFIYPADMKF